VAILDSGCDTAHDDLGDFSRDNIDGPPPAVGHALDWFSAESGWPVFSGYKVVGWQDVTDDFPQAVGPWDYHHHGTALAGVVAGAGIMDPTLHGLASVGRLTIVKFYDFDVVWHQWAGDFLAACDWVLNNKDDYRIRLVLTAVNWDVDAGISTAMTDLLAAGILPVVAVGNGGVAAEAPGFPARLANVLTVGGVNDAAAVAAFSSRGQIFSDKPDLVAPSGGLLAAAGRITTTDNEPNDTYSGRWGTSLAAAHVAGAAFLLLEAMRLEGVPPPASDAEARLLSALLKSTAAPVLAAEDASGQGTYPLPSTSSPDRVRGWGLLQIQAAIDAALYALPAGATVSDSLGGESGRSVLARRLVVFTNTHSQITASPTGNLDVVLEVHNARWLLEPEWGLTPLRVDHGGPGASESVLYEARPAGLAWVVVKRLSGAGEVVLTVADAAGLGDGSFTRNLGGIISGWPNHGQLAGTSGFSLVLTSFTDLDPFTRLVHALDAEGQERPGWPLFLFLSSSLSGSLSAPLVWDLDGVSGDEIVIASDFGKMFFVSPEGTAVARDVAPPNVALTAPVGVENAAGQRHVVVFDVNGNLYRLASDGSVVDERPVGTAVPLPPAVGQLSPAAGEEMAVVFTDGNLYGLDAAGLVLPGWPQEFGPGMPRAPVLVDFDGDGLHVIVVPLHDESSGMVVYRVFRGDGTVAAQDGAVAQAPDGGRWIGLSDPAVAGSHTAGSLRIVSSGIVTHGSFGDEVYWTMATPQLHAAGSVQVVDLPGFRVHVTTPAGSLHVRWDRLLAPLAWDQRPAGGTEVDCFVSLGWEEDISGVPNLKGSLSAWYRPAAMTSALSDRTGLWNGGAQTVIPGVSSSALFPAAGGGWVRVTCQDRQVIAQDTQALPGGAAAWHGARADSRNSGAFPLADGASTDVAGSTLSLPRLTLWPNPGSAAIHVQWTGLRHGPALLQVYDVRGRLVRRLTLDAVADGQLVWNGRDERDRPVAAGSYLLVLHHAGGKLTGRAVVTR
jgi:hypothetical protein